MKTLKTVEAGTIDRLCNWLFGNLAPEAGLLGRLKSLILADCGE